MLCGIIVFNSFYVKEVGTFHFHFLGYKEQVRMPCGWELCVCVKGGFSRAVGEILEYYGKKPSKADSKFSIMISTGHHILPLQNLNIQ